MKINTALILCAGLGKRLNPLTLGTPKPLLKLNNITILESCINREIIVAQRKEIIELRKMLKSKGMNKPDYYKFDGLFAL